MAGPSMPASVTVTSRVYTGPGPPGGYRNVTLSLFSTLSWPLVLLTANTPSTLPDGVPNANVKCSPMEARVASASRTYATRAAPTACCSSARANMRGTASHDTGWFTLVSATVTLALAARPPRSVTDTTSA